MIAGRARVKVRNEAGAEGSKRLRIGSLEEWGKTSENPIKPNVPDPIRSGVSGGRDGLRQDATGHSYCIHKIKVQNKPPIVHFEPENRSPGNISRREEKKDKERQLTYLL